MQTQFFSCCAPYLPPDSCSGNHILLSAAVSERIFPDGGRLTAVPAKIHLLLLYNTVPVGF